MSDLNAKIAPTVRMMQVIVGAMLLGTLTFAGVVLVIGGQAPSEPAPIQGEVVEPSDGGPIGSIAMVVGLVALFAQQVAGRVVTDGSAKKMADVAQEQPERLAEAFMTGLVVSCAINEGAAFFNLIAYMISQSQTNLAMAALLAASIAIKVPFLERVVAWVETKQRQFADEAALAATDDQ